MARPSTVVSGRMCSSAAQATSWRVFRSLSGTGTTSSANAPAVPGRLAHAWLRRGVGVDRRAIEPVALGELLRGLRHREPAVAVAQRLPERVLERRGRAEPKAPARAAHHVRRLAHRLGAAGEHDLRLAQQNLVRALDDRLEAGAAEPVDGDRRRLDRQARAQADVAREVDGVGGGLEHVAEDDVVDGGRVDPGPVEGGPRRRGRRGRWRRGP